jgi:predicted porin
MLSIDMFEIGALYQAGEESEGDDPDELTGYVLSGGLKLDSANKIKLQYGMSEVEDGLTSDTTDNTLLALGFDHNLSKQTRLYTQYVMLEEEPEVGDSSETTYLQFGVDHKF